MLMQSLSVDIPVLAYDPKVAIIRSTSNPAALIMTAACMTQLAPHKGQEAYSNSMHKAISALANMNHMSPFEHASITMELTQISRGVANQVVRHRIGSFTQSSTHYANHGESRFYVSQSLLNGEPESVHDRIMTIERAVSMYKDMAKKNLPEARQLLPNATEARLLWTVNARALLNFLQLRLCNRNMEEMRLLAWQVYKTAKEWFPELFYGYIAMPPCAVGDCDQRHMQCSEAVFIPLDAGYSYD